MRLLSPFPRPGRERQRGAALMLSIMVLIVLTLIVFQITMGASTDARVAKNDLQVTVFDAAIESALLKTIQDLQDDGQADQELAGAGGPGAAGGSPFGGAGGGDEGGPIDSRRDPWAKPQQTAINEVNLRVLIQDEDSKYNVLTMLTENQDEAEKAFDRVVRILDACREGTLHDIDTATARDMADSMRQFMIERRDTVLPKPLLLTDLEESPDRGLPLSLSEFAVLPGFEDFHFRDFRDAEGNAVHSIGSFLTMWTSVKTYNEYIQDLEAAGGVTSTPSAQVNPEEEAADEQTTSNGVGGGLGGLNSGSGGGGLGTAAEGIASGNGQPGIAVNVNTAPSAVLHALFDRRDIPWDFLDELVRYRNEEDEEASDPDADPVYDEWGEEIVEYQIFEDLQELAEIEGWDYIEPDPRRDFERFLTVRSTVFSIFITARASSARGGEDGFDTSPQGERERQERGTDRVKTVRCIVWRYVEDDEVKIVPLEPWEVLDYTPIEVLDFPDEY